MSRGWPDDVVPVGGMSNDLSSTNPRRDQRLDVVSSRKCIVENPGTKTMPDYTREAWERVKPQHDAIESEVVAAIRALATGVDVAALGRQLLDIMVNEAVGQELMRRLPAKVASKKGWAMEYDDGPQVSDDRADLTELLNILRARFGSHQETIYRFERTKCAVALRHVKESA